MNLNDTESGRCRQEFSPRTLPAFHFIGNADFAKWDGASDWESARVNGATSYCSNAAAESLAVTEPGGTVEKVNLEQKLALFSEHWRPKIVGELNQQQVKLVKFHGPFVWHHHDTEDELFLVLKGRFRMEFTDRIQWIEEGEFIIVPRGVEHRPVADEEVSVLLFEPASTLNTGNVEDAMTVPVLDRI